MRGRIIVAFTAGVLALLLSACGDDAERTAEVTTGGNAGRGADAITRYGCGSCHTISGISGAHGLTGPPLTGIGSRLYVAGVLPNTPPNLMRWIENPKSINEKTLMPNLHVTQQDARDIAGYLYTLR